MHKINYILSFILAITLPVMVVILSSNLIVRTSEVYVYHFNDSQVVRELPYNVEERDIARAISSYWSNFGSDSFQVYEDNGKYKDPVFEEKEQVVMYKIKKIINYHLLLGLGLLVITIAIYIYLLKNDFRAALRNRFKFSGVLSAVLLVAQVVAVSTKSFRLYLYDTLVGIDLGKESNLAMILGDPFYITFLIFTTIVGAAILALLTYISLNLTKPERLFS